MTDETNVGTKLPVVGNRYLYGGAEVVVSEVKKRGRGYQVVVKHDTGAEGKVRLKSWNEGVEFAYGPERVAA